MMGSGVRVSPSALRKALEKRLFYNKDRFVGSCVGNAEGNRLVRNLVNELVSDQCPSVRWLIHRIKSASLWISSEEEGRRRV